MSFYDILLAKKLGGGGGDITVESLSVTANGTYSAPSGKAYSPVVANVPNSYTASDEGKVVSSGALVAQTSQTIDTNGTYDTTLKNSVTVNVSGGGGIEIEQGIWNPSEDVSTGFIPFSNTHNKMPSYVMVYMKYYTSGGRPWQVPVGASVGFLLASIDSTLGFRMQRTASMEYCGYAAYMYRKDNNSASVTAARIDYPATDQTASTNSYQRYWVNENGINLPELNTACKWLSGYNYHWVAVWLPTS